MQSNSKKIFVLSWFDEIYKLYDYINQSESNHIEFLDLDIPSKRKKYYLCDKKELLHSLTITMLNKAKPGADNLLVPLLVNINNKKYWFVELYKQDKKLIITGLIMDHIDPPDVRLIEVT